MLKMKDGGQDWAQNALRLSFRGGGSPSVTSSFAFWRGGGDVADLPVLRFVQESGGGRSPLCHSKHELGGVVVVMQQTSP